ncbi:hypothetical protein MP638_005605 [Amoeboaphelidium occidentale]|nr:hypothetical protein MP638_005605 [Amoeboaphelidium occidentale]
MNKYPSAEVVHSYEMEGLNGYAIAVPSDQALRDLQSVPEIEYAEFERFGEQYSVQRNAPWNLARISQRDLRHLDYYYDSDAGRNTDIYILDSGVRKTHRDLNRRVINGGSYTGEHGSPRNTHGTHVAGIAAGYKYGVAKKATIISVRVIDNYGFIAESDALAGINWSIRNKRKRKRQSVMNLSWGMYQSSSLKRAIQAARRENFVVVAAAGNANVDACRTYPSGLYEAITVGAVDLRDQRYGSYGKCIDIFAPGVSITSASSSGDTSTTTMTGTSMAAPHVAGVAAVILSRKKWYEPWEVERDMDRYATKNTLRDLGSRSSNRMLYYFPQKSLTDDEVDDDMEYGEDEEPRMLLQEGGFNQ